MAAAHRVTVFLAHTKTMLRLRERRIVQIWAMLTQEDPWEEGR